jgi:hypothetical protein
VRLLPILLVAAWLAPTGDVRADVATECKNHYILDERCFNEPSTFYIKQLYSNLDGSIQYVELVEPAGLGGLPSLAGRTLTSTHGGVVKTFTFPTNLPGVLSATTTVVLAAAPDYGQGPTIMSGVVSSQFAYVTSLRPDFVLPPRFLATDGGTVRLDGLDAFAYARLPVDGKQALYRDGAIAAGRLRTSFVVRPAPVSAIEYYDAARDHYFVAASAPDIDALDSGRIAGWQRTGESFGVGVDRLSYLPGIEYEYLGVPVCRIYLPPAHGDTHFYSASPEECARARAGHPDWVVETDAAFYAALPDADTGSCGVMAGWIDGDIALEPVYRLWNRRSDTNHRYTTQPAVRDEMIARGWVSEGVVMCAQ